MKLMTKEIETMLPGIGETDNLPKEQTKVPLKIFDPCGRGTWFVTEFDGRDLMYGYCVSPLGPDCDELGYMSFTELSSVKNRLGLGLERDLHWSSDNTLAKVMSGETR